MIIQKLSLKPSTIKYTKKDLLKHPIFQNLDYWLDIGIKALKLKNNDLHPEDDDYILNKEVIAKEIEELKAKISKLKGEN